MTTPQTQNKILLETGTNELEIITFYLRCLEKGKGTFSNTYYGINAAKVSELIALPTDITKVANSPACVLGVFLLRGKTIPLIDICNWFNYEPDLAEEAKQRWTVIVSELNGKSFGFVSHGVDKVYRTSWESILPPHELIASSRSVTGMVLINDCLIQMVDFENITASIDPTVSLKLSKESSSSVNPFAGSKKVIVIAEDSGIIREMLKKVLVTAGFNVVDHIDGQSCWDYMQKVRDAGPVSDKVMAVITDIEMPRMDGHSLCKHLKEDPEFKKLPVVLFSSMINDALRLKGEKVGADAQITKPELDFLKEKLIELILQYQGDE